MHNLHCADYGLKGIFLRVFSSHAHGPKIRTVDLGHVDERHRCTRYADMLRILADDPISSDVRHNAQMWEVLKTYLRDDYWTVRATTPRAFQSMHTLRGGNERSVVALDHLIKTPDKCPRTQNYFTGGSKPGGRTEGRGRVG